MAVVRGGGGVLQIIRGFSSDILPFSTYLNSYCVPGSASIDDAEYPTRRYTINQTDLFNIFGQTGVFEWLVEWIGRKTLR